MPIVVPAGSLSLPGSKLRRMVSLSATFSAAVLAVGVTDPLERIFLKTVSGNQPRPYAVIALGDKHEYKPYAGGSQIWLRPRGSLFLFLTIDTDPAFFLDDIGAEFTAANFFGLVMDQITARSGQDDPGSSDGTSHLNIVDSEEIGFGENDKELHAEGRYYTYGAEVEWGDSDRENFI